MLGQLIGYKRVSSLEQNTARQLEGEPVDILFEDKVSGRSRERPELQRMLQHARMGDTIIVHSMDRLARNLIDLRNIVTEMTAKGVKIKFIKEGLLFADEDNPFARLMLNMLGSFAEFERDLIRSRQQEGIAIRKAEGKYKGVGRKREITDELIAEIISRVKAGEKKAKIAKEMKISRESIYKYLRVETAKDLP